MYFFKFCGDILLFYLSETPIFGVETVNYPFSPESYGTGVHEDVAAVSRIANSGKYYITTVR